ncbi:ribosome small subunit-dependent GTPase A [Eubacteriales bacterium OttesenSCG-928-G02]|nr:ribosome small subunit-dependent GTPase A [Eubacteriales bacterium OttesenSCG-928-G02]
MDNSGRIIKSTKGFFTVINDTTVVCRAATKLRNQKKSPVVGDFVKYEDNNDGTGFIVDILPRKNTFIRPKIANVDVFAIVAAAASPEPYLYNIDKLTAVSAASGIKTILIINKTDIAAGDNLFEIYTKSGYNVFKTNTIDKNGTIPLKEYLENKTTVFTGASGVGKSSLLNTMYPELNLQTGEISLKIERGKNTTRTTEMFPVGNGFIADTPGFSMLDFERFNLLSIESMKKAFPEMINCMTDCKYKKCTHTVEDGCAVIAEVKSGRIPASRHESYVKIYKELKAKPNY